MRRKTKKFALEDANNNLEAGMGLKEIARIYGFNGHTGFLEAYKNKSGQTPGRYKRNFRKKMLVENLKESLKDNPDQPIAGLSDGNWYSGLMNRTFKELTGKTLARYKALMRLKKPKLILAKGGEFTEAYKASGYRQRTTFSNQFRKLTGMTAVEYRNKFAVRRMKHLLREGRRPVEATKEFENLSRCYMTLIFKMETGMTPSEYRAQFGLPEMQGEPYGNSPGYRK